MICTLCKRDNNEIADGDEIVVELIGRFRSNATILDMHRANALTFSGAIRHLECSGVGEEEHANVLINI